MRSFSRRWAAVSLPLPVRLSHTTRSSVTTHRVSIPFGDTLILPPSAAVPTKNIFCRWMKCARSSVRCLYSLPMIPPAGNGSAANIPDIFPDGALSGRAWHNRALRNFRFTDTHAESPPRLPCRQSRRRAEALHRGAVAALFGAERQAVLVHRYPCRGRLL